MREYLASGPPPSHFRRRLLHNLSEMKITDYYSLLNNTQHYPGEQASRLTLAVYGNQAA